ncbi:MAG: ATP-dependent chaperone ClpB [Epsilonproteobacteria bacterium]|nr:MAG: ATP-dependent chaperone ClpB [Campylobacterota bacterium]RLA68064.1 MAG: ATP-dependent chaperone ClpB [Campylobacterota bacterium]
MHKFDSIVTGSIDVAHTEALKRQNTELYPEHLLLGLLLNPSSYSSRALKKYKEDIEKELAKYPVSGSSVSIEQLKPSPMFSQWITQASSTVIQQNRQEIAERDLLKLLPQILPNLKIDYSDLSEEADGESEVPTFLVNLNELAESGKLDPVIGRTKEIRAVMEILGRRGKNNPVLVGPAGVGKTAIVEGLAGQIVAGKVPDLLKGRTVYSLNMGSLMAGTKYRGEFEERIQKLLKFIKDAGGEMILFIDEMHLLVGAGKTEGSMDAANLLKPALARGELHCIGATTFDEYQKYILSDSALERRFREVPVLEPSKEDSIEILMGLKDKLEGHHGIKISDDAIYNAVMLSTQYITNKNLPDKAIDLLDEAASALKLSAEAMPASLVELQSEIRSKKVLSNVEKNNIELESEIKELQKKFDDEKRVWEKEVLSLKKVSEIKNKLDKLKFDLETALREQDFEQASQLKYSDIPAAEEELEGIGHDWILSAKHIALVISRQTGIPVEKILKSKQENILEIENYLKDRVFGQEGPLTEISETLISSHAGLSDQTRPLGSFLLLGPSGVGKTETAKAICNFLFNSEKNMIRLDMSEYSEKHSVAKLIGAPAGYIGYDEGGVLTEAVRRRPYSVILFDEIEKAHRDFADILLQILDDGRLTDNKGRTINFKNTIILLTSNSKNIEMDFKPEVLGRLDGILEYNSLDSRVMKKLVTKQIKLLNKRLKDKNVTVHLDPEVKTEIMNAGYDPKYGARPLASIFNKIIIRPLSKRLLKDGMSEGIIRVKKLDEGIEFISEKV